MRDIHDGQYQLIRVESENEHSRVYHAREISAQPKEAAKVIVREWRADDEKAAKQAAIISTFDFHALPRLLNRFVENGNVYLVYSFLHGLDLELILSRVHKPIAIEWIIDWAIQSCEVLEYLHAQTPHPILYNNWRLNNVMVDSNQHITLVGLSHLTQWTADSNQPPHSNVGFEIPDERLSPTNDIYGLGLLLHHLWNYQYPRSIPIEIEKAASRRAAHPKTPHFVAIIEKAMAISPQNRYQSAAEMKTELLKLADAP
jgi:serine/threonine protein kinase